MPPVKTSLFHYFKLVRAPNLAIILLAQYFTAIFIVGGGDWRPYVFDVNLFLISLSTILTAAGGYVINDYHDIKIDFVNKPDRVIVGHKVKRRHAIAAHLALTLPAIFIALLVHPAIALIASASSFLLWHYSYLKTKPFLGNIVVAALTAMCLILVAVYYRQNELLIMIYAVFSFGITLIRETLKDLEDVQGDADFGRKTIPVMWGAHNSKLLLLGLVFAFILSLFLMTIWLDNPAIKIYFAVFMIPMIFFIYKLIRSDSKGNYSFLSVFCKFLMLGGILSMVFF